MDSNAKSLSHGSIFFDFVLCAAYNTSVGISVRRTDSFPMNHRQDATTGMRHRVGA